MTINYFVEKKVDIALIEVGIPYDQIIYIASGGTTDHTNFIIPEVSIITNVGWQHMEYFGNSKEDIMTEKTGVIKPNKPVVLGFDMPLPIAVKEAEKKKSPYYIIYPADLNNYTFTEMNSKTTRKVLELIKKKFPVKEEAIIKGLKKKKICVMEEISREILEKLAIKWKLPKLPHKVFVEWKDNISVLVFSIN